MLKLVLRILVPLGNQGSKETPPHHRLRIESPPRNAITGRWLNHVPAHSPGACMGKQVDLHRGSKMNLTGSLQNMEIMKALKRSCKIVRE